MSRTLETRLCADEFQTIRNDVLPKLANKEHINGLRALISRCTDLFDKAHDYSPTLPAADETFLAYLKAENDVLGGMSLVDAYVLHDPSIIRDQYAMTAYRVYCALEKKGCVTLDSTKVNAFFQLI